MGKVIAEITMSVDGFIAGPRISRLEPMGIKGELLHNWIFTKATDTDKAMITQLQQGTGAVITGNRTYTMAIDHGWAGESPFEAPAFVICHIAPIKMVSGFVYITGGIVEALEKAKQTAGEKNVWVMGGASILQQYMVAGMIEELRLHIAPILLKQGTKLFENIGSEPLELIKSAITETPGALHTVFHFEKLKVIG